MQIFPLKLKKGGLRGPKSQIFKKANHTFVKCQWIFLGGGGILINYPQAFHMS